MTLYYPDLKSKSNELKKFTRLNLRHCSLYEFPGEIFSLKKINFLDVAHNQITEIPPCICEMNLEVLSISNNRLTHLPPEIGNLKHLTSLFCNNNQITVLPNEITNLKLICFNCSDNHLSDFQLDITKIKTLEKIYISGNDISSLTSEIKNLTCLKQFEIEDNHLSILPPEIGDVISLKIFNIARNQLTLLPPEICALKYLCFLDISHNQFDVFPTHVCSLSKLQELYCCYNKIQEIPPEISDLKQLVIFEISNNNLTVIPDEVAGLSSLKRFKCNNNAIVSITKNIGNLVFLEFFSVDYNNLSYIPPEIMGCQRLTRFLYMGNPIEYVPPNLERFFQKIEKISNIYDDTQSIHNTSIQKSVKDSILKLFRSKPAFGFDNVMNMVINDTILSSETKNSLIEYCDDASIHSILQITFSELLVVVWNRIVENKQSDEIKNVLNQEMTDAECKCFTGRVSRLVNCLSVFDPDVTVKISDNEQIGAIISIVKEQLGDTYTVEKHKSIVTSQLLDLGYSNDIIETWVQFIE